MEKKYVIKTGDEWVYSFGVNHKGEEDIFYTEDLYEDAMILTQEEVDVYLPIAQKRDKDSVAEEFVYPSLSEQVNLMWECMESALQYDSTPILDLAFSTVCKILNKAVREDEKENI